MATSMLEIFDGFCQYESRCNSQSMRSCTGEFIDINIRHSKSEFAHSFDYHFVKDINLLCKASLWCVLIRKRPINTSKKDRWIPLW